MSAKLGGATVCSTNSSCRILRPRVPAVLFRKSIQFRNNMRPSKEGISLTRHRGTSPEALMSSISDSNGRSKKDSFVTRAVAASSSAPSEKHYSLAPVLLWVAVASLGAFSFGFHLGVVSSFFNSDLQHHKSQYLCQLVVYFTNSRLGNDSYPTQVE